MTRSSLVLSLAFLLGCGTGPPATLTLTVADLPKFSLTSSIVVRGTVTREPPSDTPIIVTIAGGAETVSDTVDAGFVGVNIADVEWDVIDSFLPGVCGRFFGFHTTTIFGESIQDDGNFAYAYTAFAVQDSSTTGSAGVFADPVPVAGSFVADLIDPGMSALRTILLPANRVWPPRKVGAPLNRLLQLLQGR